MKEIKALQEQIASAGGKLIAVSKTHPVDDIIPLYHQGIRDFGENRVQELLAKAPLLPEDIHWHLIGHLQTNKVKYIVPFIAMIHTVDSPKLLDEIEKEAAKVGRVIPFLFQFHVAREESKFGIDPKDFSWIQELDFEMDYPHTLPSGVMGMATFTDDKAQIVEEFNQLRHLFDQLKEQKFESNDAFRELSMGMSSDYTLALECGSTMVRIGSLLFGDR
jgi:pyridoxal phosphate enzyme (YggS family)